MIHHRNFIKYRAEYNEIASPDNYLYLINFISSAYLSYFDEIKLLATLPSIQAYRNNEQEKKQRKNIIF